MRVCSRIRPCSNDSTWRYSLTNPGSQTNSETSFPRTTSRRSSSSAPPNLLLSHALRERSSMNRQYKKAPCTCLCLISCPHGRTGPPTTRNVTLKQLDTLECYVVRVFVVRHPLYHAMLVAALAYHHAHKLSLSRSHSYNIMSIRYNCSFLV